MTELEKANVLIKDYIKKNYQKDHWRYIDFVGEDRFLNEVIEETTEGMSAAEIAEDVLRQICEASVFDFVS